MSDYPTALAYFEQLPDGWASFPGCVANASLLMTARSRAAMNGVFENLPGPLRVLPDFFARRVRWLPEVVHVATSLAIHDFRFRDDDEGFLAWLEKMNRELLSGDDMSRAFHAPSPADLVARVPVLWEEFHNGCPLQLFEEGPTHASFALLHPAALFHRLSLESHRRTLAIALAKANAAQLEVTVTTHPASADLARTELRCHWQ